MILFKWWLSLLGMSKKEGQNESAAFVQTPVDFVNEMDHGKTVFNVHCLGLSRPQLAGHPDSGGVVDIPLTD